MANIYTPHPYQLMADKFIKEHDYCALFFDMGLGKTVIMLTIIDYFLRTFDVIKPLIIAPKFVTSHTWPTEIEKWEHLKHLKISVIAGTPVQRIKAYLAPADIYIVSRDNIVWLINQFTNKRWPYDMLTLDELTSFKNPKAQRFKAVRAIRPFVDKVVGLTGTPSPNGLIDLWAQMYLIDQGESLGKRIGMFRENYFRAISVGDNRSRYEVKMGKDKQIYNWLRPNVLSMKAEDWLSLPERMDIVIDVELPDYKQFREFKKEKILETPEKRITAFNSSALYIKLLQYANGAVYDENGDYHIVHDVKLDALCEAVELLEGKPVIILYQFRSDVERIKARLKNVTLFKDQNDVNRWNRKEISVLLVNEVSIGYGLNMQEGGNWIFWFGITKNMELYWQVIKRLHRQGQLYKVFNYHFRTKGTPELRVYHGLQAKTLTQNNLMDALR